MEAVNKQADDCDDKNGKEFLLSDEAMVGSDEEMESNSKEIDSESISKEVDSESIIAEKEAEIIADTVEEDDINFKLIWNKKSFNASFKPSATIGDLRNYIEQETGIPVKMQKLMLKGLVKDDTKSLRDVNITNGSKVMVIGSTLKDVEHVNDVKIKATKEIADIAAKPKEALCEQKMHRKVLDKGKPDDVLPGILNIKEALPNVPLKGMYNKAYGKVRLTFKMELDELWLGTKDRTEKIPMTSIRNVVSEPISGMEEYHILGIQLGPTEASRYWIYWVPAQYTHAIKSTILGKW